MQVWKLGDVVCAVCLSCRRNSTSDRTPGRVADVNVTDERRGHLPIKHFEACINFIIISKKIAMHLQGGMCSQALMPRHLLTKKINLNSSRQGYENVLM